MLSENLQEYVLPSLSGTYNLPTNSMAVTDPIYVGIS